MLHYTLIYSTNPCVVVRRDTGVLGFALEVAVHYQHTTSFVDPHSQTCALCNVFLRHIGLLKAYSDPVALDVVYGRAVAARSIAIGMNHATLQQLTVSAADTVLLL